MKFFSILREIDRRFSLGILIGLTVGALSIYAMFIYQREPQLTLDVFANTPVLDVREQIADLDILYEGENIAESGEALRILNIRFSNEGNLDLLKDRFDSIDRIGFRITGGRIVQRPELLNASNTYLSDSLRIQLIDENTVRVDPIILESDEHFSVKVLLIAGAGDVPSIEPLGKIGGQKSIAVTQSYVKASDEPFLAEAFGGDPIIHGARLLAYVAAGIVMIVAAVAVSDFYSSTTNKIKWRSRVKSFLDQFEGRPSLKSEFVLGLYKSEGLSPIAQLNFLLENPKELRRINSSLERHGSGPDSALLRGRFKDDEGAVHVVPLRIGFIRRLRSTEILVERNGTIDIDEDVAKMLTSFVEFLKLKRHWDEDWHTDLVMASFMRRAQLYAQAEVSDQ